jgi:hypothetical protein
VAIIHGPDYQRLSPEAKLALWTLKMLLGALGIAAVPGLLGALEECTGLDTTAVPYAVAELEREGWLARERNVVWLIRGLAFEPDLRVNDPKHRKFVQRAFGSLPRLPICERFQAMYATWFDAPPEGLPRPSEGTAEGHRSTDQHQTRPVPGQDQTSTDPPLAAGETAQTYAVRLVVAANQALEGKLVSYKTLVADVEQETTEQWRQAGIPVELAERVIRDGITRFRSRGRNRQPNSLKYFDGPVRDAADRSRSVNHCGTGEVVRLPRLA